MSALIGAIFTLILGAIVILPLNYILPWDIYNPNNPKKSFDVYIPSQTPGVDKNGIMVHSDGISIEKLNKLIDSPYKSVEEILTKVLVS